MSYTAKYVGIHHYFSLYPLTISVSASF